MATEKQHPTMEALPAYLACEVATVVAQAKQVQREDTINFIFMTDPHHVLGGNQLRTAAAMRHVAAEVPLDFVLVGGDLSANNPKDVFLETQTELVNALTACAVPVLITKGNHDDNSIFDYHHETGHLENLVHPEELSALYTAHLEGQVTFDEANRDGLYYYYDVPGKQTRVIVLNSIDIPYVPTEAGLKYNGQWQYAFSDEQLNWVAHEALTLTDKPGDEQWRVVILSHVALLQEDVYGADHDVKNGDVMWDILRAFQTGGAYQSVPATGDFKQAVAVDFSRQGARPVDSIFFGHVHYDQQVMRDDLSMISSLNAVTGRDFADSPEREVGTGSETAFDLVTIDPGKETIELIRFGAGQGRTYPLSAGGK